MNGADYILDMLLIYRKHKGRRMTLPVRRHAYIQQAFAKIEFKELIYEDRNRPPVTTLPPNSIFGKMSDDVLRPLLADEANMQIS